MKTNIIIRTIALLLIALLTCTAAMAEYCVPPTQPPVEGIVQTPPPVEETPEEVPVQTPQPPATGCVTLHWFERELYQSKIDDFTLEVKSEYLLDTRDYILVLRIETAERPFSKVINDGDLLGIKDGYILFALEWAEEFMTEIRSWQPAN